MGHGAERGTERGCTRTERFRTKAIETISLRTVPHIHILLAPGSIPGVACVTRLARVSQGWLWMTFMLLGAHERSDFAQKLLKQTAYARCPLTLSQAWVTYSITIVGPLLYHKLGPLILSQAWAPYSITSLGLLFYHKLGPLILSQAWAHYSITSLGPLFYHKLGPLS